MNIRFPLAAVCVLLSQFLFSQDKTNTLWYRQPTKDWNEALPVGNGRIGAMVFGNPWKETIQINEESLWGGCPQDGNADAAAILPEFRELLLGGNVSEAFKLARKAMAGNPMRIRSYQTFGELYIDSFTSGPVGPSYERSLDLLSGIAKTTFSSGGVSYSREVFASAPDNVLVIRFSSDKPESLTFTLSYKRQESASAYPLGTGVLAILAAKMGAKRVWAIDIDAVAAKSAWGNVRWNRVSPRVQVLCGDASLMQMGLYDVILANIHRNILIQDMSTYVRSLRRGGKLLVSGFFPSDEEAVSSAALSEGLTALSRSERGGWVSLGFTK